MIAVYQSKSLSAPLYMTVTTARAVISAAFAANTK